MKKILCIVLILMMVIGSFSSVSAIGNMQRRQVVQSLYGTYLSWGAVTSSHYYCNPGDRYAGSVTYIDKAGTVKIQVYKVGNSKPLAEKTVNGPFDDDIGESIGIDVTVAGYYYVKITNTSSGTLVIDGSVLHD